MKNFIQKGDYLTVTIPAAVTPGAGVQVGAALFGVAANAYAMGEEGVIATEGVFSIAKDASVFAAGALAYWDNTAKKVTSTAASNLLIGTVVAAAATGDATAKVLL